MNSKLNIFRKINAVILTLIVASVSTFSMKGQLSASHMAEEFTILDKLIRDIKWDTYSKYLLYHNIASSATEIEENQSIEIWMIDLGCWNSEGSEELNELLCVQELEYAYPLENWMLEEFNVTAQNNMEYEKEDKYPVEEWMYDLQRFKSMN
ncbi:MAG TPA: hypothetical protein VJ346_01125 [Bacteroidales bacterium]|nr:hypothetical protein [Bacteroidales bacterium]